MFTDSRAQHFLVTVLGVITALSPIWVTHSDKTMWSLIVLGVLIALTGLVQMYRSVGALGDYALGVFGVLLFISPWVMDFASDHKGASWTAWVVGVVTVVAALAALPMVSGRLDKMVPHH
ncbi:SPW repeat domain-containing protein [Nocardia arthritidis]|uniref:SPW repeat-containing integral membrane domain-containing protein n=1 Tax=Nocardia arthritidis TaxID=228602 RepID=A0A6G9YS51_9NOCA|nr:SPW repeat protein [Nocardia arthritidis]QIS15950.1 hypothetical protein F5544_40670 [Nocardia arthritidis]